MDFLIAFLPENKEILPLLDGAIGLVETMFPERIRAHYLTGSFAEGTAVSNSDLDMITVFKDKFSEGEADKLRQLRHHATKLSPYRLDLTPKCEADLIAKGATGLKLAGKFLYGTDIREQIPFEPIEQYRHDVVRGWQIYQREIRGDVEIVPFPITPPDPDGEFLGYEKFGNWQGGDRFEPGTRVLINLTTIGATASLTVLHDERAGSKWQAIEKYQKLIGDEWGDWLAELYQLAKMKCGYAIPQDEELRQRLRSLIQRTPDYENMMVKRLKLAK